MRAFLALIILLLGLGTAAPEPEYSSLIADYVRATGGSGPPAMIEIESATSRGDRLAASGPQTSEPSPASFDLDDIIPQLNLAPLDSIEASKPQSQASLDDLCNALFTSAEDNNLPVPFFANLIWQESRLRDDAVSRAGALGIAQFMPKTAMESGLSNPFDPLEAIPASARLLRELRDQFGNLGFVAAAYNAGARRVAEWLEHRRSLPRETLNYVYRVTGRSAEEWRKSPPDDAALQFVPRLPCRAKPEFAQLEEAQRQQLLDMAAKQIESADSAVKPMTMPTARVADRVPPRGRKQPRFVQHHVRETVKREARRERPVRERYKNAEGSHRSKVHRA